MAVSGKMESETVRHASLTWRVVVWEKQGKSRARAMNHVRQNHLQNSESGLVEVCEWIGVGVGVVKTRRRLLLRE